jgi:hypothetical protein
MTFAIDSFYHDSNYGVIKFKGYKDGLLLFDRFEKSFVSFGVASGWLLTGQRVNIREDFQLKRYKVGKVRPIPPPQ